MDISPKKCTVCDHEFTQKKNLYAHYRKIHKIEPLDWNPKNTFSCNVCKKRFSCQATLIRHTRTLHAADNKHDYMNTRVRKTRLICPYENCSDDFLYYDNLHNHLAHNHGVEIQFENLTFNSIKEFETWKEKIQQDTFSMYTKDTKSRLLKSGVTRIFMNCHRSYCHKKKGKNKQDIKSLGSTKIGKACPSRLEVTVNENAKDEPIVSVKYWKTHFGHTQQIGRITLNKKHRLKINNKSNKAECSFSKELDNLLKMNRNKANVNSNNNSNLITKTELLLSLLKNIQLSAKASTSVEKEIDKLIELLNKSKEINLNMTGNIDIDKDNEEQIILIVTEE